MSDRVLEIWGGKSTKQDKTFGRFPVTHDGCKTCYLGRQVNQTAITAVIVINVIWALHRGLKCGLNLVL